jgi:hypothetical protein
MLYSIANPPSWVPALARFSFIMLILFYLFHSQFSVILFKFELVRNTSTLQYSAILVNVCNIHYILFYIFSPQAQLRCLAILVSRATGTRSKCAAGHGRILPWMANISKCRRPKTLNPALFMMVAPSPTRPLLLRMAQILP